MQHADRIAERILSLGGEDEMVVGRDVEKIHDAAEMLAKAKALEEEAITMYNAFARQCGEHDDSVSKKLFEDMVQAEEGQYDQFDRQADFVRRFGESCLALKSCQGRGGDAPPPQ